MAGSVSLSARSIGYDAAGRVVWTIQPSGQSTTFTYDANGNIESIASITPSEDTDGDGIPDYFELQFSGLITALDPALDGDNDQNNNLIEFAFALRPGTPDGFALTPISISPPDPVTGDEFFTLKYIRPQSGTTHLSYTTEISFDLTQPWITGAPALSETVVPQDGGVEEVTVEFTTPISSADKFFMRIEVETL